MPITEVPTSTPPEKPPLFTRSRRYEDLDHSDLLHVIDDLEGSRSWASLREKIWIALIIHMLVAWYLIYGPKYIYHVRVVDPSIVLKDRQKDLTYLDLPPDALKKLKPKTEAPLSDRDRVAETKNPTLDRKTLQQLEAMRRAGPPKPVPEPTPQQSNAPAMPNLPTPQQPQVAQARPQTPPAQPLPQNNQSKVEAPSAPQPNFQTESGNPNEAMQQALRQAARGEAGGQYGGDMGQNAPLQHPGVDGAVQVLSDTQGWDYGPYLQQVIAATKRSWYPQIPESARPPLNKQGQVGIRFSILRDGTVVGMTLELPSGDVSLDRAAWGGITGAAPYQPLPGAYHGKTLDLRFFFLYNTRPGPQ
jgi:outer membrane biosynthesis protein TonB